MYQKVCEMVNKKTYEKFSNMMVGCMEVCVKGCAR